MRPIGRAGSAKQTPVIQNQLLRDLWVCLTHDYQRVQEEKWQVSFRTLISWEQRTEEESSLPINASGSKRARARAQREQ